MKARTETGYGILIEAMPPGATLTLQNIGWEEYEDLLHEFDERPGIRFTYDQGRLEIMTLSAEHEGIAGLFPALVLILAEECRTDYLSRKSTTMRKRKKSRGLEPDDCFYFRNFKRISGKKTLDLTVDPPPDLAIEVDVTSGSMNKFPIYAAIGVPELWRHDGRRVQFYRLVDGQYTEITHSDLFPFLTPDVVSKSLRKGESEGTVAMAKAFRTWVRRHNLHGDRQTSREQ
jgi:Uma2 family endonuclease